MAANFNILTKEFLSQFVNGPNFTLNLSDTTNRAQYNEGEIGKIIEKISVSVTVNPFESVNMLFTETTSPTFGILSSPALNFQNEGLWNGAIVDIEFDSQTVSGLQVGLISGPGFTNLQIEKAALIAAGLLDLTNRTDIVIKLVTAPKYVNYKYGFNQLDLNTPNYSSPFDTNEQSYYAFNIPNSPATVLMTWVGSQISADLGTAEVSFDGTVGTYNHQYTIQHVFKVPYYLEGEQGNLKNQIVPFRHAGTKSLKYGNGWFFGGVTSDVSAIFEDVGGTTPGAGNIGYPGESFNGGANNYEIESVLLTNSLATEKLETTVANTVTFGLRKNSGVWIAGQQVILTHTKLPTALEYANKTTSFNSIWLFENLTQDEGVAPVSGTIITAYEFNIDGGDPNLMNVTVTITYTALQQELLLITSDYWLEVTVGDETLSAELSDRVNLTIDQQQYSKNTDVTGLVLAPTMKCFPSWSAYGGGRFFNNFSGGNGDLWGVEFEWVQSSLLGAKVTKASFLVVARKPTGEEFNLLVKNFDFGRIEILNDGVYNHQIVNVNNLDNFNLPITEPLNEIFMDIRPPAPAAWPSATQTGTARIGFQTPWQQWIENLSVDNIFYDIAEENNNKNFRSSNYSGISSYEIRGVLRLTVENDIIPETPTIVNLYTDPSTILDFDVAGWTGFTRNYFYYDAIGNLTLNLLKSQAVRIEIECNHSLGVLSLIDLKSVVWIEEENATGQPWFLSSSKDFTDPENPLQPTQTITPTNTEFVEMVSVNNKVTLICQTNRSNLTPGIRYKVRGRLWSSK